MPKVEELQEKVKVLKTKIGEEKDPGQRRALRKRLKRYQRKIRFLTGKKLAAKRGQEPEKPTEAKPGVPSAGSGAKPSVSPHPASAPAPAKPAEVKAETQPAKENPPSAPS